MGKRLEEEFLQRRQTNYHQDMESYWTSFIIKEKQIKDTMRCHLTPARMVIFFFFYIIHIYIYIYKLYNIVLVLPYINMNPPQVYTCSPSWTLLPPHTIPLGHPSAPAPSIQYCESNLDWQLVSYMILYMFQCQSTRSKKYCEGCREKETFVPN